MTSAAMYLSTAASQQRFEVIAVALVVCFLIFELIRRKRLMERYAILWLVAGVTVLLLSLWQGLLTSVARGLGISYTPSALFAVAFLFVLVMLVHFSMTISKLSDQNTILAQRLALLQQRLERAGDAVEPATPAEDRVTGPSTARSDAGTQAVTHGCRGTGPREATRSAR
jgi:hypothetical protein